MRTKRFLTTVLIAVTALFFAVPNSSQAQEEDDGFTFGGAVRYNLYWESYDEQANPKATWDTWRLNVDGSVSDVDLSFEYRFYPTFGTHFIHHGFLGYAFSDNLYMELGVTQVPFGITTYASHSWWFQGPYYVGLEDDYDMGINFDITPGDKLKLSLSYFRQAEPGGPWEEGGATLNNGDWGSYGVPYEVSGPGRYSYDIIPGGGAYVDEETGAVNEVDVSVRELNQFNMRLAYNLSENWELGLSAQFGQLYNSVREGNGEENFTKWTTAYALHTVGNFGNFNLKAEYINYNYNAQSDNWVKNPDIITMGAYGSPYDVAAKANLYVVGLAYSIPVEWGPISNIQPYIDYTLVSKPHSKLYNTEHLVPGMLFTAGSIYTYVDYAMGKNQPWLTGTFGQGLGKGLEDPEWKKRFNINIGYYF